MFFVNLKLSNKRVAFLLVAFFVFAAVVFAMRHGFASETTVKSVEADSTDEICEYLNSFGLKLGEMTVDEVIVPYEFNEVYINYNKTQKSQGFDLSDYKGKRLCRYTFSVLNHPSGQDVFAEVLVYEKVIVGADIYSIDVNGFISPLK